VAHVAAGAWGFFDAAGFAARSQRAGINGRGDSRLGQQNNGCDEDDEARTGQTFSGQLPVPTSREFNSYLDCKNPAAVPMLAEVPAIFRSYGREES
jgi:hypothetical protein